MILAIPMKIPSVANFREHWRTRANRSKAQRKTIALHMKLSRWPLLRLQARAAKGEQIRVTFIRVAPRKLDDDNLAFAFKSCRDEVAAQLGINDGTDAVVWVYKQQRPALYGFKPGVVLIAVPVADVDAADRGALPPPGLKLGPDRPTAPGWPQRRRAGQP